MIQETKINCADTAKILLGTAITNLSHNKNQPHNIFNGAFRAVCFLGRNRIESQSLILDTVKKVQSMDFKTPNASVTGRFDPCCNDTFVSEKSSEICSKHFLSIYSLLTKIGVPHQIIIESLLQSCIDYGTSISSDSRILISLLLNAVNYSFEFSTYD